jgi:uncharacterized membrane protein YraQ (UPF0718 family)/YHS domain-containing protein
MIDKKDPICGMQGTIKHKNHYFCSDHCIEIFDKKKKKDFCPSCTIKKNRPWYKEKLYIFSIITIFLIGISYIIPSLNKLNEAFIDYFSLIWWAVILGFIIGGIIDYFIPREYISKFLASHKKKSIFYAVGFGFLMSACSHGILAIAIELYKKGASVPSVVAFLLASPWANMPITILLFGFFGLKALLLVVSAIVIALITGFIYQKLSKHNLVEKNNNSVKVSESFSIIKDLKKRIKKYHFSIKDVAGVIKGSWALTKMIGWWLLIGVIISAFIRAFVPDKMFMDFMGPTVLGLFITLAVATIIEVCSEGSSVLAFEIFNQTKAFGNSFTFLMAGVATDYTEIGLIWSNIGRKAALWLPIITVPQILILGYLFNLLL